MYNELVKRLREVAEEVDNDYDVDPHNAEQRCLAILEAADVIEELNKAYQIMAEAYESEVTKHHWIPVEERLPGEDGCYLVAVKNDHKRRYSKTAWFSHDSWFARQDVTHWMPLPSAPMEE